MMDPRLRYCYKTFYRVPFLVPAWDRQELRAIWRATVAADDPWGPSAQDALQEALAQRGFPHTVLTSSGGWAIEIALRSLERPGGEVIIPTFLCGSVLDAVVRAGCVPVLADITDDLTLSVESVRANLTPNTIAVLVAHLGGKPAHDLSELVRLCRDLGIALIDDAAQALGVQQGGAPLGTFGDFGILSFGLGKPTFSIGGGGVVFRSAQEKARGDALLHRMNGHPEPRWREVGASWNFVLEYGCRRITQPAYLFGRAMKRLTRQPAGPLWCGPISRLEAGLQIEQLRKLERILERFTANGRAIIAGMAAVPEVSFPQASPSSAYTKLIMRVRHGDRRALAVHLLRAGIEIEETYTPLGARPPYAAYRRLPTPVAEGLWASLFALPVHPELRDADLALMMTAITRFFRRS